jgi:prevent-host-death family protein
MSEQGTTLARRVVTMTYARAHLYELVRAVEAGGVIAISLRGEVVAQLRPFASEPEAT